MKLLEKLAKGIVRAQEVQQTHALKQRIARIQRDVAGYSEPPTDHEREALMMPRGWPSASTPAIAPKSRGWQTRTASKDGAWSVAAFFGSAHD